MSNSIELYIARLAKISRFRVKPSPHRNGTLNPKVPGLSQADHLSFIMLAWRNFGNKVWKLLILQIFYPPAFGDRVD